MKFICKREDLLVAARAAKWALDEGKDKPALGCFKLSIHNGQLSVMASKLAIAITAKVPCKETSPGEILIPGKRFLHVLAASSSENFTLESEEGPDAAAVIIGEARYRMLCQKVTDFPGGRQLGVTGTARTFTGNALSEAVRRTEVAAGPDTRYTLNCVQMVFSDSELTMTACDGGRWARQVIKGQPADAGSAECSTAMVPLEAAGVIRRLAKSSDKVCLTISENGVTVASQAWNMISGVLSGRFPNVVFSSREADAKISLPAGPLLAVVRRIGIMANQMYPRIDLQLKDGSLLVSTDADVSGDAKETLPVAYDGKDCSISVPSMQIASSLGLLGESQLLILSAFVTDKRNACLVGETDDGYTFALMAMG